MADPGFVLDSENSNVSWRYQQQPTWHLLKQNPAQSAACTSGLSQQQQYYSNYQPQIFTMAYQQTAYPYALPQQATATTFYPPIQQAQRVQQIPQSAAYMTPVAPITTYDAYVQTGVPQQQAAAFVAGGRVFNSWSGVAEEKKNQDTNSDNTTQTQGHTETEPENASRSHRDRSLRTRRSRIRVERSECPECERFCRCGTRSCTCSDQEGSCHSECSCSTEEEQAERDDDKGDDSDGDDDDTHTPATSTAGGREQVNYEAAELVHEVHIHPGGSGRVAVHLDSTPPRLTVFVVSARRMRAATMTGRWAAVCHRGTDACDTTVGDKAAVLGMYWMLRVIHQENGTGEGSRGTHGGRGTNSRSGPGSGPGSGFRSGYRPGSGSGSGSWSEPSDRSESSTDAASPVELPARVLAYVALFGYQFGVLPIRGVDVRGDGENQTGPFMLMNGSNNGAYPNPYAARLRGQAGSWLHALTSRPRNRRTLEAVLPADWPYLLYASRALGNREVFGRCVRTMLQRWFVDSTGQFCDATGQRVRLDVPDAMRETVARDLASLKSARDRSIEAIVTAAVAAFES